MGIMINNEQYDNYGIIAVRCLECENNEFMYQEHPYCNLWKCNMRQDDFCSYGIKSLE